MNRFFKAAVLLILFTTAAPADPAWKGELTSPTLGPHPKLEPCALDYRLSWKGMVDSGKLRIQFAPTAGQKKDCYVVQSSSSSTGAAAVLFPFQAEFWSELDPSTLRPRLFHATETDSEEIATTTVRHFTDRVESQEVTQNLKSGISRTEDRIFQFTPVYDIFSAMLHVRCQKLAVGDRVAIVICPFKTPYLLRVLVDAREVHLGRQTIRLNVSMQKIDRKTLALLPYKKLKGAATLWLSDDADRVPIEFRAAAFVGDVRAILVENQKP